MEKKFVSQKEIQHIYGIPRSTMYKWMKTRNFPLPIKIGIRKSLWRVEEIDYWFNLQSNLKPGKDRIK